MVAPLTLLAVLAAVSSLTDAQGSCPSKRYVLEYPQFGSFTSHYHAYIKFETQVDRACVSISVQRVMKEGVKMTECECDEVSGDG